MGEPRIYNVIYTQSAVHDIEEKADYIAVQFRDVELAEKWYQRLRGEILEHLATFPYKFALYDRSPWRERGVRLFDSRNDVILYMVDDEHSAVYVLAVCTKGRNLNRHLTQAVDLPQ